MSESLHETGLPNMFYRPVRHNARRRAVPRFPGPTLQALLVAVVCVSGCALPAFAEWNPKGGITEISDIPWEPVAPRVSPKVIYGTDDRIDVYQETDPQRLIWAASTCALIDATRLTQNPDGSYYLSSVGQHRRWGLPPCEGEPFGDQPTAAYCTGFMVGEDLIVTAGHCFNSSSLAATRFVFGFWMEDSVTPRLSFSRDDVYQGVEVISFATSGPNDHCVVRVDRPITAVGARPFRLRREGVVAVGEPLGVIGHPSGLPLKIAFGPTTAVRRSADAGFFVANLDTYAGNSGSPVINAATGILEGILVRGEVDYLRRGSCFVSNVVPDDGGRGEDATKSTVFAGHVPEPLGYAGTLAFDRTHYGCDASVTISVRDLDLQGVGTALAHVYSTSGDEEAVLLEERQEDPGVFRGTLPLTFGHPFPNSGAMETGHGDWLSGAYIDENDGTGQTVIRETAAQIDCVPPLIHGVDVTFVGGTQASIRFITDEAARPRIFFGEQCGAMDRQVSGAHATVHVITLSGLDPNTRYHFAVQAEDHALNASINDNQGFCYQFHTHDTINYFTEQFNDLNPADLDYYQATFVPIAHPSMYQACVGPAEAFPSPVAGTLLVLGDDDAVEVPMRAGTSFPFYGIHYDRFYVGSNGYVTFGQPDTSFQNVASQHFLLPRVSALMRDLNPAVRGTVHVGQLSDRCVITFLGVPSFDGTGAYPAENSHSFQIELFLDGVIRITWLELFAIRAVAGLSAGLGQPLDFTSINITGMKSCGLLAFNGACHSADTNVNWRIELNELLRVVQLYHAGAYSCDSEEADGYAPGPGHWECSAHDADYQPRDWRVSMSELLRVVQLYNATAYRPDNTAEDGFRPVP